MPVSKEARQRYRQALELGRNACTIDDVALLDRAVNQVPLEEASPYSTDDFLQQLIRRAVGSHSPKTLEHLLAQGGCDVNTMFGSTLYSRPDKTTGDLYGTLDVLLAHGWDIDAQQRRTDWPLLWFAVEDPILLQWCLDHGASVCLPGDTPPRDAHGVGEVPRTTVLERAAGCARVESFEKLRARGAPVGERTLQYAVQHAAWCAPKDDGEANSVTLEFEERMHMVHYLIRVVGLDVNGPGNYVGTPAGSPLSVLAYENHHKDTRGVIWHLLDHGADPDRPPFDRQIGDVTPLALAESRGNVRFTEAVKKWRLNGTGAQTEDAK